MSIQDRVTEESGTASTVETPSCLILFYSESTPIAITTHLPTQPIIKPVGSHVTLGRSGGADIRLNDERMSRLYAAVWHDGKDPFIFRVSNLSERKLLIVDGTQLRHLEEAEVKDGNVLTLDFLELRASVRAGDYVAKNYQVSFRCQRTLRQNALSGGDISSILQPSEKERRVSLGSPGESVVDILLTRLQAAGLCSDAGPRMNVGPQIPPFPCPCSANPGGDVRIGCREKVPGLASSSPSLHEDGPSNGLPGMKRPAVCVTNNLPPNILPSPPPSFSAGERTLTPSTSPLYQQQQTHCTSSYSSQVIVKEPRDVFPSPPDPKVESVPPDLVSIAQRVQRALVQGAQEDSKVCPGCCHGGGDDLTAPSSHVRPAAERTPTRPAALDYLRIEDPDQLHQILERFPVEHEDCEPGECDTDDPSINAYMH